jgi:glycine/D-amino acid oxidase-like deaminating enzyme
MPAPLEPLTSSPDLPTEADAVVIGGGIVGACTAWFLAKAGLKVALIEKGRIGGEQSSRNWGWCRQQNRDAAMLPMATASLRLWEEMTAELDRDLGFQRCGLLYLSDDDQEMAEWAAWSTLGRDAGVTSHVLSAEEATRRGGVTGKPWRGGIHAPSDGIADPSRAAPRIAGGVIARGGSVHQFCAARGLEQAAGRVTGVITERGTIRTNRVVLAGGAWASSFCHQLGITMPQATVRATALAVMPGAADVPPALHSKNASITRRGDGGFTIAISQLARLDPTPQNLRFAAQFLPMFRARREFLKPGDLRAFLSGQESRRKWALDKPTVMERIRVLDPTPSPALVQHILQEAHRLVPELARMPLQTAWSGYVDCTPDGLPVIDDTIGPEGFVLAAGFSGQGFGTGPGAGRLIADLVCGTEPEIPYKQLALSRLSKGHRTSVAQF